MARYGLTRRPTDSGFPALEGWSRATRAGVGFPTIKCEVQGEKPGYWNLFGWIQWVTQDFPGKRSRVALVDRLPAVLDRDVPFASMGYAPTFFDAPAYNSLPAVNWRADLFLCTLPAMSRREPVIPLAGFKWGYRIDTQGGAPVSYPLEPANQSEWHETRLEVAKRHPRWNFANRFVPPRADRP